MSWQGTEGPGAGGTIPWVLKSPRMVTEVETKKKIVDKKPHGHKGRCLSANISNPTLPRDPGGQGVAGRNRE